MTKQGDDSEGLQQQVGELLALVVHDLRNPVATVSANVSFVREVGVGDDPDVVEALEDVETALGDLMRGFEQLGWIGRWMTGKAAVEAGIGTVQTSIRQVESRLGIAILAELPTEELAVQGGGTALSRMLEILVVNASIHAPGTATLAARREGDEVWVEMRDGGKALGPDLHDVALTLAGQNALKGRADGRYSRVAGLLALRALTDAVGARFEAAGEDGAAVFRLRLEPAS